jgi:putative ABC transport system ATP-binding protein
MALAMIRVRDLVMRLTSGGRAVTILESISFDVAAGEVVAITGPSGSGKSTLLGLIAGLDAPSAGSITIAGVEVTGLGEAELARFRRRTLGFVFQAYHLIPTLTAAENVAVPLELARAPAPLAAARQRLAEVGLTGRVDHYPSQLSGGEQQRVAIARAMALAPPLVLADEPTGNLDSTTGAQIIDLLLALNQERGATLVLVTHDASLAARAGRAIALRDGRVVNGSGG